MHQTPAAHSERGGSRLRGATGYAQLLSILLVAGVAAGAVASIGSGSSSSRPIDPATAKAAGAAVRDLRPGWFRGMDGHPAATVALQRPLVRRARGGKVALTVTVGDIPPVPLAAYREAAASLAATDPSCHLPWALLAGIGGIESDHARSGGSTQPGWNGVAQPPILGPLLDGSGGFAAVRDTDRGRLDGNAQWDRAVGPMQFLPSSWVSSAADGNHDGVRNPEDIYDATLGAGVYLCRSGADLSTPRGLATAAFSYNHSVSYVQAVLMLTARYAGTSPAALGIVPQPPRGPGAAAAIRPAHPVVRVGSRPTPALSTAAVRLAVQADSKYAPATPTASATSAAATTASPTTIAASTTPTAGQTSQNPPSPTPTSVTTTATAAPLPSSSPTPVAAPTTTAPTTVAPTTASATPTASTCPSPTATASASPTATSSPTASPSTTVCPSP